MALAPITNGNSPHAAGGGNGLALALEESELRYRRLFETAQDGILILDAATGKIMDVNPFLLDLLGYPFETMIGRHLWEIGSFEDIAANQDAFSLLQEKEYIRYEDKPLRTSSGKQIAVEFVSNVYLVGNDKVIQCNIRDVTARVTHEHDCNDRLHALEITSKAREDVLAIVSHELRTPLAAISSIIDLVDLSNDAAAMLPQPGVVAPAFSSSAVAVLRRNVDCLVRLITDLLDLSHFTKGSVQIDLQTVDAHELIGFALKNVEHVQKSKEIALDLRLHAVGNQIQADPAKLEQVILNLLSNALKFTPAGGTVSIVTRNDSAGDLLIEVHDTGIGIEQAALTRIFSPFAQSDVSIHPRFGGLGLGLSIARTIVNLHGGSLSASSEGLGCGATFTVRLRAAKVADAARVPSTPGTPFRILLAEDNNDARRCLAALLESAGYETFAAPDMKSALEYGVLHDFDLLIADLGLPDGDGADLLSKLRETTPALQAIAISGFGLPDDASNTRADDFFERLVKPVRFSDLKAIIEPLRTAKAACPSH